MVNHGRNFFKVAEVNQRRLTHKIPDSIKTPLDPVAAMHIAVKDLIESRWVSILEHQRQVVRISPVLLFYQLSFYFFIKRSAGQWIGDGNANFVRHGAEYKL